ncbi:MAG: RNA polymerase sigma factor [Acidimicrobiales bacterium]
MEQPAEGLDATQEQAFADHVVPELDLLWRVALSLTRNPSDAEDLVQDTLLRAFRGIGGFDGRHPRAWVLTIMRNAQINRVRRRRPELLRDAEEIHRRPPLGRPHEESAESVVVAGGFDAAVDAALASLPERYRQVVELVDVDGLRYKEAAEALGIPVGTVMSRLHRARRRIQAHLAATEHAPRKVER